MFGQNQEAIRVKVKKCDGTLPAELRKFSVDPQITSFDVLHSILGKAFDLKSDFSICYRIVDGYGNETFLPLLSDWDLDAAFLKATNLSISNKCEPCLYLRVDLKSLEECGEEWEIKQPYPLFTQTKPIPTNPESRLHGLFNQVGKTINLVQKAFNFGEDENTVTTPPKPPLSDEYFWRFLDPVGQIINAKELRSYIYFGGIEPSLRKVVWKHILNVYPKGMTGKERMDYIKKKASEYVDLKKIWKNAVAQGLVQGELAYTTGMVKKDVLRTDRHHEFYAGNDDNENIAALFNILTTYALNHPKVSYCQGMSDIASPLLVTMNDEAHAYICFCALMQRLSSNFMIDGIAMTQKFSHLSEGIMYYDPEFYNYLKVHQADDLLFCYRWLLLEMKREFAFEDSLRMLEVLWSSLPADPPDIELKLFDIKFQPTPVQTPPISPLVKTPRENPYTKICALRRRSSSISLSNLNQSRNNKMDTTKRLNHSLDESIHRSKSDDCGTKLKNTEETPETPTLKSPNKISETEKIIEKKSNVSLNNKRNNHKILDKSNSLSSSMTSLVKNKHKGHFKDLKEKIASTKIFSSLEQLNGPDDKLNLENLKSKGKMVKNFNEFLNFASVNKNKISDTFSKISLSSDGPKITLTKSSFEDSESGVDSGPVNGSRCISANSNDNTFEEYSPDDSHEYYPLTTSVTREIKLESDNLDKKVFGDRYKKIVNESPSTECSSDFTEDRDEVDHAILTNITKGVIKKDEVFVWENPLHQDPPSPGQKRLPESLVQTPEEQSEIEFDPVKENSLKSSTRLPNGLNKENLDSLKTNGNPVMMTNSCEEVTEATKSVASVLPPPHEFGGGNPFLMFLCITVLLQHRDHIMEKHMDYNEMAMHFDKMIRRHNVVSVLNQARQMYASYMKQQGLLIRHQINSKNKI